MSESVIKIRVETNYPQPKLKITLSGTEVEGVLAEADLTDGLDYLNTGASSTTFATFLIFPPGTHFIPDLYHIRIWGLDKDLPFVL